MRKVHVPLPLYAAVLCIAAAGCHTAPPPATAMAPMAEIDVNQQCMIRPEGASAFSRDPIVCHLESQFSSTHVEERIDKGVTTRTRVHVVEHEYLLQDVTTAPVTFVIRQAVPPGWRVDSDPQPDEVSDGTAVFRVIAQPQQTVRLHVGERHEEPIGS